MTECGLIEVIEELNEHIYQVDEEKQLEQEHWFELRYATNVSAIYFDNILLWDSESYCEDRDNGESILDCVKRRFNEYLDSVNLYKFHIEKDGSKTAFHHPV